MQNEGGAWLADRQLWGSGRRYLKLSSTMREGRCRRRKFLLVRKTIRSNVSPALYLNHQRRKNDSTPKRRVSQSMSHSSR